MLQRCHIVVKEKPTVGSPVFATFPSARIPKAMKDVNVQFSVHSSNSCTLYQRYPVYYTNEFRELSEAPTHVEEHFDETPSSQELKSCGMNQIQCARLPFESSFNIKSL